MRTFYLLLFLIITSPNYLIAQNDDTDPYVNLVDQDDDNDGILDANECDLTLNDIYAAFVAGQANFYPGGTPDAFLRIKPSDFGYPPNGTSQQIDLPATISKDYSDFFGMPTGSIIITLENANVHQTADDFFVNARPGVGATTVTTSGTMGIYLQMEHNVQYFPNETRTLTVNDGSNLSDGSLFKLAHQDTDTNWSSDQVGPEFSVTNLTTNSDFGPAQLNYAAINPQVQNKSVTLETDDTEATHMNTFFIRIFPECDYDKDGIPNRLDRDSDNDGCPDSIEADGDLTGADITTDGSIDSAVDTNGVPVDAGGGNAVEGTYDENALNPECVVFLPVKLVDFTVTSQNNNTSLNWRTASEINNSHFEIQRSINGVDFETIGRVNGAGNSTEMLDYDYIDYHAATISHTLYYRLKQVDFDNQYEYSDIRIVIFSTNRESVIFPNPAAKGEHVELRAEQLKTVRLYSITGQLLWSKENIESNSFIIETDGLEQGFYLIKVNDNEIQKLIVK